ncbi:MAG: 50S ribosomal protein L21 [Alphaproteobacteria bacterium]|nr:50S ribosomal protein L21 [Alphaproteobacteria bacterium]
MFAVIKTGGKQYKVAKDDVIEVEKLPGAAGASVDLTEVLMLSDGGKVETGSPLLAGAKVSAEVVEQTRGDKIIVFKKRRRKNYRRKKGHRQDLTVLKITGISRG